MSHRSVRGKYAYHEYFKYDIDDLSAFGNPNNRGQLQIKTIAWNIFRKPDGNHIIRFDSEGPMTLRLFAPHPSGNRIVACDVFVDEVFVGRLGPVTRVGGFPVYDTDTGELRFGDDGKFKREDKIRFRLYSWDATSGALVAVQDSEQGTILNTTGNPNQPLFPETSPGNLREVSFFDIDSHPVTFKGNQGAVRVRRSGVWHAVHGAAATVPAAADAVVPFVQVAYKVHDESWVAVFGYTNPNGFAVEADEVRLRIGGSTQSESPGAGPGIRRSDNFGLERTSNVPLVFLPGTHYTQVVGVSPNTNTTDWRITTNTVADGLVAQTATVDWNDLNTEDEFHEAFSQDLHIYSLKNKRYQRWSNADFENPVLEEQIDYDEDEVDVTGIVIDPATNEPLRLSRLPNDDFGEVSYWHRPNDAIRIQGGWLLCTDDGELIRILPPDLREEFNGVAP